MEQTSWGHFMRRFRKDRGMSLAEAVKGAHCAPSTLSRFERDEADISINSMKQIMANLVMNTWDFREHVTDNAEYFTDNKLYYFMSGKTDRLRQLAAAYSAQHSEQRPMPAVAYTKLIYRLAIEPATPIRRLQRDQEQLLAQLLQPFQGWNIAQRFAIYVALRFASHELLSVMSIRLSRFALAYDDDSIQSYSVTMEDLSILLVHLVARHEIDLAHQVAAALEHTHTTLVRNGENFDLKGHIMGEAAPYQFAKAVLAWREEPTAITSAHVRDVIHDIRNTGMDYITQYYQECWDTIQSGVTSWHDVTLNAPTIPPAPLHAWAFTADNLRQVRNILGLDLGEVAVDWTSATQSRFEKGQTQLGFKASLKLLNALLLDYKFLFGVMFDSPETALSKRIEQTHGPDFTQRVKVALAREIAALPKTPRNLYLMQYGVLGRHAIGQLTWHGKTFAEACAIMGAKQYADATVAGILATRWIRVSDVHRMLNTLGLLDKEQYVQVWRHVLSHTRIDSRSDGAFGAVATQGVIIYYQATDVVRLRQLWGFLTQMTEIFQPTLIPSVTGTEMVCRLFMYPEQADTTIAALYRAQQAMHNLMPTPAEQAVLPPDAFTVCIYYLDVFKHWRATAVLPGSTRPER
ncbi:helix-turn-helix domain-containing protein [Lacticaseibacillus thailandensis]|uniref:HTH cro/C1-type domain-containing protein n=1 Tax=Lacticaseibacillus thailandensis DSM 22698 = JCM 13996 TaxID=1423810 RepID=A0A0R2CF05_9LACO|nr:helix-turn-helix transcriptional regulator [Lacticaseibacillus thailandensis]KRM87001.1 hypothetical protein FD19_GL001585 [Lacticaseibacillus thailandensis DSM 22698 = JCM 13996]